MAEASHEDELAALIAADPALVAVAGRAGPFAPRRLAPGFAGLAWVVTGQQISTAAGRAIFSRMEAELGEVTAEAFLAAGDDALRRAGQSAGKVRTLRGVAAAIAAGEMDLDRLAALDAEAAVAALVTLKGIGRWTAEVYLLFAHAHPDVFPAGDLALQEAARLAFDLAARPADRDLRAIAERWRPHRGLAAHLLWAYYRAIKARSVAPV